MTHRRPAWFALVLAFNLCAHSGARLAFCQSVSGNITLSAGSSSTTVYLAVAKPGLGSLGASAPLSIRDDFLDRLALTALASMPGSSVALGRIRLKALAYFPSADRGAGRGGELLTVSALGTASDSWGAAVFGRALSFAASLSDTCASAALQWRLMRQPLDVIVSGGSLFDIGTDGDWTRGIHPWLGLGLHAGGRSADELNFRSQLYFGQADDTGSSSWIAAQAGAVSLDAALNFGIIELRAFGYAEAGVFRGGTGTSSSYDAYLAASIDADLASLPLARTAALRLSVKSLQGLWSAENDRVPAYGKFPNPLLRKYWPEIQAIEFSLGGKRADFRLFRHEFWTSAEFGASLERLRAALSATLRAGATLATSGQAPRSLSIDAALSGDQVAEGGESDTTSSFSDIEELEELEENPASLASAAAPIRFETLTLSGRAAGPNAALSCSLGCSLEGDSTQGIAARLRASARLPQCSLEASVSMKYAGNPPDFSISSARIYARIPF